ncbi:MAG: cobalamin biosynthesis protein CbiA [candidate division Zixibacteria bacterium]|nr:cobalamin biosynthesis protein CbiA [candidate division Zixibacteria bacterium]
MEKTLTGYRYPDTSKKIIIIIGGFGSGKTEVSVNLAKYFTTTDKTPITLVDLDLVNPYFRSREVLEEMEALGVHVVCPTGGKFYADLPILLPQIKGLVESHEGLLILDVGGDSQGAKALGSISSFFVDDSYEMVAVLNSRRPQTSDVSGCLATMQRIELTAKLKFTGLVSNSHMIEETDLDVILEGYELSQAVSAESGLPLFFISGKHTVFEHMKQEFDCPVLPMTRSMLKPWERKEKSD